MDETARRLGLPDREIFPAAMPRYPNLWFFVAEELALRREYNYALRFLDRLLAGGLGLRDSFYSDVENPNLLRVLSNPGEGSDYQARIGPIQPWPGAGPSAPAHAHQLHARFYPGALLAAGRAKAEFELAGRLRRWLVVPASVHYEVATEEPSHPYVDDCPICGISGEYKLPIDPASQDYCLKIHDPLGLEFMLHGRVRGAAVAGPDGRPCRGLAGLDAGPDIGYDEYAPGPYGCVRLARIMIYQGRTA